MDPKTLVPLLAHGALFLVMVSFGLRARARDVLAAMRHSGLLLKGILAVNIVVPLAAVIACSFLPIDRAVKTGIVLMAVSPLAPVIPGRLIKAGLDASVAVGFYVAMILTAVIFVPATVALLSAIYPADASISVMAVGKLVALTVVLPISFGLAIDTLAPDFARRAAPVSFMIGLVALGLLVLAILYKQGEAVVGLMGDGSVLAIAIAVTAGLIAGHLLGRPDPMRSNVLATSAAIRHPGIAALVANANFKDPRVILAVILFLLTSFIVTFVYQQLFKRTLLAAPNAQAVG